MTANLPNGLTREQNDRLLELAYAGTPLGCRHDYGSVGLAFTERGPAMRYTCTECNFDWWREGDTDKSTRPAVGDGREPTTEELIPLAHKHGLHRFVFAFNNNPKWQSRGSTFHNALARAILAAVDGEQP